MIGSTLSHYRIDAELGRGGMGIVYRAHDTKLNREVALKVLPSAALATEDDRARFYREAQAAAQLHHPNIATIFEIDEAVPSDAPHGTQPSPFIAMEFIEGDTVETRIKQGPMKVEEAVRIASEIAGALELAHEKNIVHRDIKCANVMLTGKGVAKVLDFGLAKTAQSTQLTRMGSTLGTVAYMSPEQARGEEVDGRTDIWALGVVIYEMIAGVNPFGGDYEQAVVYSILNSEPEPLTAIRTGVPMELERIVFKLLAKSAENRYQRANDLLVDLRNLDVVSSRISSSSVSVSARLAEPAPLLPSKNHRSWLWALAGLVMGIVVMQLLVMNSDSPSKAELIHSQINLPPGVTLAPGLMAPLNLDRSAVALSRDGRKLAIVGSFESTSSIYLREMSGDEFIRMAGTEGAYGVAFSPSGEQVAFFSDNRMNVMPTSGGSVREVARVALPYNILWLDETSILYDDDESESLKVLDTVEGSIRRLQIKLAVGTDTLDSESFSPRTLLPNGQVLASSWSIGGSFLIDLNDESATRLPRSVVSPKYFGSGFMASISGIGVSLSRVNTSDGEQEGTMVPCWTACI